MTLTVSTASTEDDIVASLGHLAEEDNNEGGSDEPVGLASIEELPATSNGSPALARKHGEVRHCSETADVGGEIVVPATCQQVNKNSKKN
jgi:hypothetical protein